MKRTSFSLAGGVSVNLFESSLVGDVVAGDTAIGHLYLEVSLQRQLNDGVSIRLHARPFLLFGSQRFVPDWGSSSTATRNSRVTTPR